MFRVSAPNEIYLNLKQKALSAYFNNIPSASYYESDDTITVCTVYQISYQLSLIVKNVICSDVSSLY